RARDACASLAHVARRAAIAVLARRAVGLDRMRAQARTVADVARARHAVGRTRRAGGIDAADVREPARLHARLAAYRLALARVPAVDRAAPVAAEVVAVAQVAVAARRSVARVRAFAVVVAYVVRAFVAVVDAARARRLELTRGGAAVASQPIAVVAGLARGDD